MQNYQSVLSSLCIDLELPVRAVKESSLPSPLSVYFSSACE